MSTTLTEQPQHPGCEASHSLELDSPLNPGLSIDPLDHRSRWIQRGFLLAILLACGIALANNEPDPDLWGHVRYAQDALASGKLHRTATHTFTAEGYRWINHENLAELALAQGYELLGARGLVIAKATFGFIVLGLMIFASLKRGASLPVAGCYLLLTALTLSAFWAMRPQLASFLLLTAVVVLLNAAFAEWQSVQRIRFGFLWLLPPLFTVWTNSHGAFVAGVCLVSGYLGIRGIELIVRRDGGNGRKYYWHLVGIGSACWLFTLFNPYGMKLHLWLAESLGNPRPEITEWAAPRFSDEFFMPFVALSLLSLVALIGTRKKRDPAQLALLVLCFWQATCHVRHIALFAILAGFWVPVHLDSTLARFRRTNSSEPAKPMDLTGFRVMGVALLFVFVLLFTKLSSRLSDFPVKKSKYPVAALQYIADHDLNGRLVVSFDWAQYALAALAPDTKVQFDGRFRTCYPQEVIDMHFDFLIGDSKENRCRAASSGPFDATRILQHGEPNLILVDRRFRHSVNVMEQQQQDFVLLYQDSTAQVWGRTSVYDDPAGPNYLTPLQRKVTDEIQVGSVTWPAFPQPETL